MSRIKPEEVREIATLARLRLTDQEVDRMTVDLDAILGYVAALRELDTSDVEPMTHAVPFDCPLRPDVTSASLPIDDALRNAPRREANFFQVPRIIARPGAGDGGEDLP
ncbi:MAG TPA: Asp-tRNA(Asn)/Glu-tRNA(Gln) amidotransferase subunit GatC [Polyangia bacterium]|nr:Asp-tRNA(Asn)/Glu-tRNA(Gln) amidotransferase subunit GatC [Polyangia bacterium]